YSPGENGSITGATSQIVNHGASGTAVEAIPDAGYHFVKWSGERTDNPRTAGNVPANISVTARLAINTYTVTAIAGGNGAITPPTQSVDHGDPANFTVEPEPGYHAALTGDTCTPADNGDGTWTATNITSACAVVASFTAAGPATVTVH